MEFFLVVFGLIMMVLAYVYGYNVEEATETIHGYLIVMILYLTGSILTAVGVASILFNAFVN